MKKILDNKKVKLILIIVFSLLIAATIVFMLYIKFSKPSYVLTKYAENPLFNDWENLEMYAGHNGVSFVLHNTEDQSLLYIYDKDGNDITPKKIKKNRAAYSYYCNTVSPDAEHKTDGFAGCSFYDILDSGNFDFEGNIIYYDNEEIIYKEYNKKNNKKFQDCAKKNKGSVISSNSNVASIMYHSYYRGTEYDAMYYLYDEKCNLINDIPYDIWPLFISDSFIVSGFYTNDNAVNYNNYEVEVRDGKGKLLELEGITNGEDLIYLANDKSDTIYLLQNDTIYKLEAK